jgi:ribonuclease P protein component
MQENKIRKNVEFRAVYRRGKSFSNHLLVLYIYKNKKDTNRIGVSVSKKVGKSVIRNRVKRLIKECYRLNTSNLNKGYDLVFIARSAASDKGYNEIDNAIKNLFKRAGLYN